MNNMKRVFLFCLSFAAFTNCFGMKAGAFFIKEVDSSKRFMNVNGWVVIKPEDDAKKVITLDRAKRPGHYGNIWTGLNRNFVFRAKLIFKKDDFKEMADFNELKDCYLDMEILPYHQNFIGYIPTFCFDKYLDKVRYVGKGCRSTLPRGLFWSYNDFYNDRASVCEIIYGSRYVFNKSLECYVNEKDQNDKYSPFRSRSFHAWERAGELGNLEKNLASRLETLTQDLESKNENGGMNMKPEGESVLSDDNPEEEIVRLKESLKKIREFLEFITVKK